MLEKTEKFISNNHPNIVPNNTNTLDHLKLKLVGGTSCAALNMKLNTNIFDYTVKNFIKSSGDQQVMTTSLQAGGTVLPGKFFTNVEHKNYSSKHMSSTNYNDVTTTTIRPEIPSTFIGGSKYKKMLSIKDTTQLLKHKKLIELIGKGNLKMFNIVFNYNINKFLQKIEEKSSKKISKKDIDEIFKKIMK